MGTKKRMFKKDLVNCLCEMHKKNTKTRMILEAQEGDFIWDQMMIENALILRIIDIIITERFDDV